MFCSCVLWLCLCLWFCSVSFCSRWSPDTLISSYLTRKHLPIVPLCQIWSVSLLSLLIYQALSYLSFLSSHHPFLKSLPYPHFVHPLPLWCLQPQEALPLPISNYSQPRSRRLYLSTCRLHPALLTIIADTSAVFLFPVNGFFFFPVDPVLIFHALLPVI